MNYHPLLLADCSTEEEIAQRRHDIANGEAVLKRILHLMRANLKSSKPSKVDYDSPSWACVMADWLGHERAVATLEKLVAHLDQKEDSDHE